MLKSFRIPLILFLFISLGWYNFSNTYFYHSHIINGKIVHHSHPYSKEKQHNHTENEFIFLKYLENNFRFFLKVLISLLLVLFYSRVNYFIQTVYFNFSKTIFIANPIRAPSSAS